MNLNIKLSDIEFIFLVLYITCAMLERVFMTYFFSVNTYMAFCVLIVFVIIGIMKKINIQNPNLFILALLFVVYIFISWAWSAKAQYIKTITISMYVLSMYMIANRGISLRELDIVKKIILLSGTLASLGLILFGQNYYGDDLVARISLGDDVDPNYYALTIIPTFIIAIVKCFNDSSRMNKGLDLFYIFVSIYGIFLTGSRGALLACVITFFLILIYKKKYIIFLMFLCGILCLSIVFSDELLRYSVETALESGGAGRTDIWLVGWEMIKDNFFLGVGVGNFEVRYSEYSVLCETGYSKGVERAPHNFTIELLSQLGIIGFLLYIGMFYYTLREVICKSDISADIVFSVVAIMIANQFLQVLGEPFLWILLGISGAIKTINVNPS